MAANLSTCPPDVSMASIAGPVVWLAVATNSSRAAAITEAPIRSFLDCSVLNLSKTEGTAIFAMVRPFLPLHPADWTPLPG